MDSAFPELIAPGVKTVIGSDLGQVIEAIRLAPHVRADAFLDSELDFLTDDLCPGVEDFKRLLDRKLEGVNRVSLPHDEIIAMVDESAKTFRVLIVKTPSLMPYTSLFLRLECGYWSADSEAALRARITRSSPPCAPA